ncbi:MAG TPA: nuclear transport factor 2 family protein [bacterium]|nr:nuclear transport factor 2 family protein [bacterium]
MYPHVNAQEFAKDWIKAWNSHDLNAILSHYAEDVQFTSPFIVRLMNEPTGTIHGKDKLKPYFEKGLKAYPDLKFELAEVLEGVSSVTLYYKSVKGLMAAEVMFLNEKGLVQRVVAHYNA